MVWCVFWFFSLLLYDWYFGWLWWLHLLLLHPMRLFHATRFFFVTFFWAKKCNNNSTSIRSHCKRNHSMQLFTLTNFNEQYYIVSCFIFLYVSHMQWQTATAAAAATLNAIAARIPSVESASVCIWDSNVFDMCVCFDFRSFCVYDELRHGVITAYGTNCRHQHKCHLTAKCMNRNFDSWYRLLFCRSSSMPMPAWFVTRCNWWWKFKQTNKINWTDTRSIKWRSFDRSFEKKNSLMCVYRHIKATKGRNVDVC